MKNTPINILNREALSHRQVYEIYKRGDVVHEWLYFEFDRQDENAEEVETELIDKGWTKMWEKESRVRYKKAFEITQQVKDRYIFEYELKHKTEAFYQNENAANRARMNRG